MRIGIITGSGTYSLPGVEAGDPEEHRTPFGTALLTPGRLGGVDVVHCSRHHSGHRLVSHQVDHRSNVVALRDAGVDAVLAVTVCGSVDPDLELGSLLVFDDLFFLQNRLPDGSACTLHTEPGAPGRGHWVFDRPFSGELRGALLEAAREAGHPVRDGGVYGHVDGPRFNTRSEIRLLRTAGVTAVSQTAGPETVLCGEAGLPYALVGFATDYANGVKSEPTPVEALMDLIGRSTDRFADVLTGAVGRVGRQGVAQVGTSITWD